MGLMRVGVILVTVAMAFSAAAEDKDAARKAFSEGQRYYNLNQYAEALDAFKRAYWNYEEPTFLYNIAQCHRALKHKAEAIEFYRSYLRNAPQAPNRAEVERIIAELDAALQKDRAVANAPPEGTIASPPPPATTTAPQPATTATSAGALTTTTTTTTPSPRWPNPPARTPTRVRMPSRSRAASRAARSPPARSSCSA